MLTFRSWDKKTIKKKNLKKKDEPGPPAGRHFKKERTGRVTAIPHSF